MARRPTRLLRWANGSGATLVEPDSSKAEAGYATGEEVPAGWLNTHLHLAGAWAGFLRGPNLSNWTRAAHAALTAFDAAKVFGLAADTATTDTADPRYRYALVGQVSSTPALRVSRRGIGSGWVVRALPSMTGEVRGIAFVGVWLVWSQTAAELWSSPADDGTSNSAIGTSNAGYWTSMAASVPGSTVKAAAWCAGVTGRAAGARHAVVIAANGSTTTALLYSTDSGATWSATSIAWTGTPITVSGAYDATRDRFFAVAGSAQTAVSPVGSPGGTWTTQLGPGGIGAAIAFTARAGGGAWLIWGTALTTGTAIDAAAYRSTDAGATWTNVSDLLPRAPGTSDPVDPLDIAYVDGVWVMTVADAPYLYASQDDGDTWERVPLPVGEESSWGLSRVVYADGQVLASGVDFCVASGRAMATEDATLVPDAAPSILSDAYRLRGRTIATTAPTSGQVYAWNSGTSQWEPVSASGFTVTTTRGDIIVRGASVDQRLAVGASGRYLRSDGTDPSWAQVQAADITGAPWSSIVAPATVQTTDATTTTIATIATTTDKGHALDLTLGATLGDRSGMVAFKVLATVTSQGGTLTLRDELVTASDGGASGWTVGIAVGGTDISVKVTGGAGETIDWICAGSMLVHGS